jgi:hypothetical protein
LRVIGALREIIGYAPAKVYGCEVWRDLDWLCREDRVAFDVSGRPHLSAALLGVFDSQISGGKRYDLAAEGRRRANATFSESHGVDEADAVTFAMDLTPLVIDKNIGVAEYVGGFIDRFRYSVIGNMNLI